MQHRARTAALCTVLASALAGGCATIDTRSDSGYTGNRVYSGLRQDMVAVRESFFALNPPFMALWLADSVPSFLADTFLLPITIPEQSKLNAQFTQQMRTDIEQPSVLTRQDGEPLAVAKRLFRECSSYVLNLDLRLTDCYSIGAKVEIKEGAESFTGAQYKLRLREEIPTLRGSKRFERLKDPKYEEKAPNVEISFTKEDSNDMTRTPVRWLVGPGSDGNWRILEEDGPGFP